MQHVDHILLFLNAAPVLDRSEQLMQAGVEIAAQTAVYRRPLVGVTADQARRVRMLSEEVAHELEVERASRCAA